MSDVVTAAVDAVNALTPGMARGRPYAGDDRTGLPAPRPHHRRRTEPSDDDVAALRVWTDRLRTVFAAVDAGDTDAACIEVNALLADTGAAPVLARHGDEPWHLHFHALDAGWATSWAAPMATALAVVLGGPMHDRLGVCSAPECDRVFADTSRNGTRRFCSTACQNRVKTAAFRARRRAG